MKRILIDTDIGGDVDDALALAMALNTPDIEIVGITNVYLANAWRAGVTKHVLQVYGRENIPVCTGAEKPLLGWWDESRIPNSSPDYGEFGGKALPHACDFIIEKAMEYDDLILVAIGPLTNVGLALAKAPHIASRIKIILMGGQLNKAHPEWNIVCDPEAARIVFESGADITMVGLDVTNRTQLTREEVDEIKSAGNGRLNDILRTVLAAKRIIGMGMKVLKHTVLLSIFKEAPMHRDGKRFPPCPTVCLHYTAYRLVCQAD